MRRVLGLDLGSRTCGIAVSDPMGMIARTVETFRFNDDDYEAACNRVVELCKELKVDEIVLGLPKNMSGEEGSRAEITRQFGERLKEITSAEIVFFDERLTTVYAENTLNAMNVNGKNKTGKKDALSAVLILQGYMGI